MAHESSRALLAWFRRSARKMAWRETDDPYRIWVSEIMLQQTPVRTVAPYYERFLAAFPTVRELAAAPVDTVLKLWEGLGYYARARNLHRAARAVAERHGGTVPASVDALMALPGIGRSTAGAIAAIAFRKDAPILDANARRVLARLHRIDGDPRTSAVQRRLWDASRGIILAGTGRETALALMDLGADVCTPRRPRCPSCPLAAWCRARREGVEETIPRKARRRALPRREEVAAAIEGRGGRLLIVRRPEAGLLGGLWELPGGTRRPGEAPEAALSRVLREELSVGVEILGTLGAVSHGYSHFRVTLHGYRCRKVHGTVRSTREWRWATAEDLEACAFTGVVRKLLDGSARPEPERDVAPKSERRRRR